MAYPSTDHQYDYWTLHGKDEPMRLDSPAAGANLTGSGLGRVGSPVRHDALHRER